MNHRMRRKLGRRTHELSVPAPTQLPTLESEPTSAAVNPPAVRASVHPRTRIVVGAVIGSMVALIVLVVAILLWKTYCQSRLRRSKASDDAGAETKGQTSTRQLETGKEMVLQGGDNIDIGRPSSAYSSRPLSDPFAAEVKTVVSSRDDRDQSPVNTPRQAHFSYTVTEVPNRSPQGRPSFEQLPDPLRYTYSRPDHTRNESTASAEIRRAMPELSETFLANVRPTAHSPPPTD